MLNRCKLMPSGQFTKLVSIISEVCPDSWIGQHKDSAMVFVPSHLKDAHEEGKVDKILITVWIKPTRVEFDIRDEQVNGKEPLTPETLSEIRERLVKRLQAIS